MKKGLKMVFACFAGKTSKNYITRGRRVRQIGSLSLAGFFALAIGVLAPYYITPEVVEATTGTATESSLTFTSVNPTAAVAISVSDPAGTFATSTDAQKAKFTLSTTNFTGYTATIKSTSGNTLSDGANTLAALGETVTPANFALATNTKYNNKWGILPNYYNSAANTSYISMPASGSITLDETSAANTTAKEYTIGLGVRADYTYKESTFYNTFVIEYVANPINYAITYDGNAPSGKTVTKMPTSPQSGNTSATSITLATAEPEAENHEFKGWCTVKMAVGASCTGTTYQPGATYGIDQTASNTLTLYAMWEATTVKLYDMIAGMSKGNFDMANINVALTTDNSGVYKYTGSASDGSSGTQDIYFYRGILDSTFTNSSNYGSSGDGALTPNYVKLTTNGNTTCWRIFRTTKTGGVKMLYNGLYANGTCANASSSAQLSSTAYYNRGTGTSCSSSNAYCGTLGFVTYVGYNYNSTYKYNNTSYTSAVANSTLFNNGTASNIRTQVENWYSSTIGSANNGLFEWDAGYCNDRSTPSTNTSGSTTTTVPYKKSSADVYFGAYVRTYTNKVPSLQCPNTSGNDLLNGTTGKSYPVALITIDEAVLAGNGASGSEAYSASSYLTSGSGFWSLSPYYRYSVGRVYAFIVGSSGNAYNYYVCNANGVRPAISLAPETLIYSGKGTATDPWIVQAN